MDSLFNESPTRKRKRNNDPIKTEIKTEQLTPTEHTASDFTCPICFNIISEAYMTRCGHSYCHSCIQKCLSTLNRCPQCNFVIENSDEIFPNFLLNELITKYNKKIEDTRKMKLNKSLDSSAFMLDDTLDITNINTILDKLNKRKKKLEGEAEFLQNKMLSDFLTEVHQRKLKTFEVLKKDLDMIKQDLDSVNVKLECDTGTTDTCTEDTNYETNENIFTSMNGDLEPPSTTTATNNRFSRTSPSSSSVSPTRAAIDGVGGSAKFNTVNNNNNVGNHDTTCIGEGFNSCNKVMFDSIAVRRRKIADYYDDLESCYMTSRTSFPDEINQKVIKQENSLDTFKTTLSKFSKFNTFRPLATLNYASDIYSSSSIVSSIEFDRDGDYFAIAGVTKKIKVFEYSSVIQNNVSIHYPVSEMICSSKISSIIWSTYHKGMLASSDYDGIVTLWDAFTAQKTRQLQEHEKRCWSIDFNQSDPKLLASGSDDTKVKLWYTNMPHSIACIDAKANVCCVKFSPTSRYHIAFGSADHCVHYYDLRNTSRPITTFKGHKKAVSYTKFLNSNEIVSASTDSQLKLWNVNQRNCVKTYQGHTNDKNFVGLATDGDYITCGSENNSLYVYYKGLSKQIMSYKFDTIRPPMDKGKNDIDDGTEFVSAVCWKKESNTVVTANSQGVIKILDLV